MSSQAKVWYECACDTHGIPRSHDNKRYVKVGQPKNKRMKLNGGCPQCNAMKQKQSQ
jgi:hypothetical protein